MSDYVRLPVGEGMIRIKYETAEWSPTKAKLILKGLIDWYCEADPDNQGTTKDGIVMIDAADVKQTITNPIRFGLEWGDKTTDGGTKIPDYLMGKPLDAWEEITPSQSKSKGNPYGGGGPKKPKLPIDTIDRLHDQAFKAVLAMIAVSSADLLVAASALPDGATLSIGVNELTYHRFGMYVESPDAKEAPKEAPIEVPPLDDSEIPF